MFLAKDSINLEMGPFIIMVIMGLKFPEKFSRILLLFSDTGVISAVNVKSNLPPAAPKTTLFGLISSFFL